jgi:hypothetical protein
MGFFEALSRKPPPRRRSAIKSINKHRGAREDDTVARIGGFAGGYCLQQFCSDLEPGGAGFGTTRHGPGTSRPGADVFSLLVPAQARTQPGFRHAQDGNLLGMTAEPE